MSEAPARPRVHQILATLGYGDLVPVSEVARGLAVIETVSGQLFIAIMIARLVGACVQMKE